MRSAALIAGLMAVLGIFTPRAVASDTPAGSAPSADLTSGIAPVEVRPAEGELEESDFPACATNCQRRLDASLVQCEGYANRADSGKVAVRPAANCRPALYGRFESCLTRCHERYPGSRSKYR